MECHLASLHPNILERHSHWCISHAGRHGGMAGRLGKDSTIMPHVKIVSLHLLHN
jgi:hypothetical protein